MKGKIGNFILSIILFTVYIVYPYLIVYLLKLIGIDISSYNQFVKTLILTGVYLSLMLIIFLIYRKDLINDFKDYKNNFNAYFIFGSKIWLTGLAVMYVSNIFLIQFLQSNATNEILVQEALKQSPLYMIFSTVIFAPFTEEIIFRKSIRNFISNDYIYMIISAIAFGYIHTLANYTNPLELLYIIPYGALGYAFAYTYTKKKNIFVPITFHMFHNAIAVTISLMSYFLLG